MFSALNTPESAMYCICTVYFCHVLCVYCICCSLILRCIISLRWVLTAGYKYSITFKLYPYYTILYSYIECPVLCTTHHIEMHHLSEAGFNSRLQTRREVVLCLHQHPLRAPRDIIIIIII